MTVLRLSNYSRYIQAMFILGFPTATSSQVVIDNSFSKNQELAGPNFHISEDFGKIIGNNLFHSFDEFNLHKGQSAIFTGPNSIENILGRVTGSNVSKINGIIRSEINDANLYLLNPNGFIFGKNAMINVKGSLTISTRNNIKLGKNGNFNALSPKQSLLVSAKPEAFGFLGGNPEGTIKLSGAHITLSGKNKHLGLNSANLIVENNTKINANEGANIKIESDNFNVTNESVIQTNTKSDVNAGNINVDAISTKVTGGLISADSNGTGNAGSISIHSKVFIINNDTANASVISSNTHFLNRNDIGGKGGEVLIASDSINIKSGGFLEVESHGSGRGGALTLQAEILEIDGGKLTGSTYQTGEGGEINIMADNISLNNSGYIESNAHGQGNGGVTNIQPRSENTDLLLNIRNQGRISSATFGDSIGGTIDIKANILNMEYASISTDAQSSTSSSTLGGSIKIQADRVILGNLSSIASNTSGKGNAGQVYINSNHLSLDSAIITSNSYSASTEQSGGNAGLVKIDTKRLNLRSNSNIQGSSISTDTYGLGNAGRIEIDADKIYVESAGLVSSKGVTTLSSIESTTFSTDDSAGRGGDILIEANEINVKQYGRIITGTEGEGDAGYMRLETDELLVGGERSSISGRTGQEAGVDIWGQSLDWLEGTGGDVNIKASTTKLYDGGRITTQSFANGNSGNLNIDTENISIENNSYIIASSLHDGKGGSIGIITDNLSLKSNSSIESVSYGNGEAGNIRIISNSIESDNNFSLSNSFISSSSQGHGNAGDIRLESDIIFLDNTSIQSSALFRGVNAGNAGAINMSAKNMQLSDNSKIVTSTEGPGNAGNILLKGNAIKIHDSHIASDTDSVSRRPVGGNAGSINIKSQLVEIISGSSISSKTSGMGDAGNVNFISNILSIYGNSEAHTIINTSTSFGESSPLIIAPGGVGGNIKFDSKKVEIMGNSMVSVESTGNAPGGNLTINSDEISISGLGTQITGRSGYPYKTKQWENFTKATGAGGIININSKILNIQDSAQITVETTGLGIGGELNILGDLISISEKSTISASTKYKGTGGSINISGNSITISNKSSIESSSINNGLAGSLNIHANLSLELKMSSNISATSIKGNGGNVGITGKENIIFSNSNVSASAAIDGGSVNLISPGYVWISKSSISAEAGNDGGNLNIENPKTLALHSGDIVANAVFGTGGNISIISDAYLPSQDSIISASSEFGLQGVVVIETPDTDIGSGLITLPDSLESNEVKLIDRCTLSMSGNLSSFFLNGNGGVPIWSHSILPPSSYNDTIEL